MVKKNYDFETRAIHAHQFKNQYNAVTLPIYRPSTFGFDSTEQGGRCFAGEEEGYIYTRLSNPTNRALEQIVASLEGGEDCVAFGSGMAATASLILHLCSAGDNVIYNTIIYGGTMGLAKETLPKYNIGARFFTGDSMGELESLIDEKTRLVFLETPANPTMKLIDIHAVSKVCKRHGILLCVDNTFCSPYIQQPLKLGADLVMHSGTKYLNGHGDVIAGFIVGKKDLLKSLRLETQIHLGGILSPSDAWLISGLLKTNPKFNIFKKQMKLGGGLICFEVGKTKEDAAYFCNHLYLCTIAVSLGDCDTLIQHPASMTHSSYTDEELKRAGITPNMVRLSVGLENARDIINDLRGGLSFI